MGTDNRGRKKEDGITSIRVVRGPNGEGFTVERSDNPNKENAEQNKRRRKERRIQGLADRWGVTEAEVAAHSAKIVVPATRSVNPKESQKS